MTINRIRASQRYKVLLPHFQLDYKRSEVLLPHFRFVLTAKDLNSASALPLCINRIRASQRYKVLLPHFQLDGTTKDLKFCSRTSVLSWLLKIWIPRPHFRSALTAKDLKLHFHTALTTHDVKFHFRISALPWCDMSSVPPFCSANSSKDVKFSFQTSALSGLLKVWSFASALPLCLHCQRCEVPLSTLLFCQDLEKSQVPLPHLFDQDFQIYEVTLPHFISAGTSKDVKFVSALLLCLDCQRYEVRLPC